MLYIYYRINEGGKINIVGIVNVDDLSQNAHNFVSMIRYRYPDIKCIYILESDLRILIRTITECPDYEENDYLF